MVKNNKNKTYIITTAQACATPNHQFLDSLETLADKKSAEIIIQPVIGQGSNEDYLDMNNIDKRLQDYKISIGNEKLNSNIALSDIRPQPQNMDPISSTQRFAQIGTSLIIPSTKQRWQHIAHSNSKMPKAVITTGACTQPNYATDVETAAERRRRGLIAKHDHEYGAIIVEVENGNKYHWRNIMGQVNGKLTDFGVEYDGKKTREVRPLAMACGDWHNGYGDFKVRKATLEMIMEFAPHNIALHDFFNGHSISHHMQRELIYQMIREGADKGNLSLEKELMMCGRELNIIADHAPSDCNIKVVQSNHLEFLDRYLDEGRFIKDPHNARISFDLAALYADGVNPVEAGIEVASILNGRGSKIEKKRRITELYNPGRLKGGVIPQNVEFLKRESDFKVNGYQLANHGDTGPGGGYGSIKSKENDFGKSLTGHVHKSEKIRNTFTLGCMIPLDTFYIKGNPVAWTHTHGMIYQTGVQMMNIVDGRYKVRN